MAYQRRSNLRELRTVTFSGPRLRPGCEAFYVDEIPLYPSSGEGEHVYALVEKRDLTTELVAELLARAAGIPPGDVGAAGRKDRHAITRQWFSLRGADPDRLRDWRGEVGGGWATVQTLSRHGNKLRPGHLRGNRFRLGLADVDVDSLQARLAALVETGVPNRFGRQRFGLVNEHVVLAWGRGDLQRAVELQVDASGEWHIGDEPPQLRGGSARARIAQELARGQRDPARLLRACGGGQRRFLASVAQSMVFNAVLSHREEAGLLHLVREGDLLLRHGDRPFLARAEELAQLNEDARPGLLALRCTGPLPGRWTKQLASPVLAEERAWSADTGIDWSWCEPRGVFASDGLRRPLVTPFLEVPELTVDTSQAGWYWLSFALPSGSYATVVLEELGLSIPVPR